MCVYEAAEVINAVVNVVNAVVQVQEARVEKAEHEYNAQLYSAQAKKTEDRATTELQEGIEKARRQRLNAILNASEQKTLIASGNLGLTSQTSLNIVDDEKLNGELDALTTMKTAQQKYTTYIDRANQYYANAELSSSKAKNAFMKNALEYVKRDSSRIGNNINGLYKKGKSK